MNYTIVKTIKVENINISLDDGCIIKLTPDNWVSIDISVQHDNDNYGVKIVSKVGTEIWFTTKDAILIGELRMLTGWVINNVR